MLGFGIAFIGLLLLAICVTYYFSEKIIHIKCFTPKQVEEMELESGSLDIAWLEQLDKESYHIPSPYGYSLSAEYYPAPGESMHTVVFCHGVTVTKMASIKYMKLFYEMGCNCLIYDHRRHGDSGGHNTTYGYYEKYDLQAVIHWFIKNKADDHILGIHGESMGAAILLQYGGMEDCADYYIADCPYASIWDQVAYRLKVEHRLPAFPLLTMTAWMIRLRAGFFLKEVSTIEAVKRIHHPILFIHGEDDYYIPPEASDQMHAVKPGKKDIFRVQGARHAKSLSAKSSRYEDKVFNFLRNIAGIDI